MTGLEGETVIFPGFLSFSRVHARTHNRKSAKTILTGIFVGEVELREDEDDDADRLDK